MSLASMADARVQRRRTPEASRGVRTLLTLRSAQVAGVPPAADAAPRDITPLPGANDVARYVPTEAIVLYIPILAGAFDALSPPSGKELHELNFSTRWQFFVGALVATAALAFLIYVAKKRSVGEKWEWSDIPWFEMTIAVIAMAAWGLALPDTPLADFSWYEGWIPPVLLLGTTALLPLLAAALGKTPPIYVEAPE